MTHERIGLVGVMHARLWTPNPDLAVVGGVDIDRHWRRDGDDWLLEFSQHNAFVNQGLQNLLNRWALGTGTAPSRIFASSDNTAVTAASTTAGGTFRTSTMNATFPSLAGQTMSFQADFTKGASSNQIDFSVRKLGICGGATDTAGSAGVQDIIGGAGVSPWNEALTIDLTSTTSFTFRPQIDCALTAV